MTDKININDIGTDLQVTIKEAGVVVDVSTATTIEIELTKPGGTKVVKVASNLTNGTDGVIHYVTLAGVIDRAGIWAYRAIVTFSATQKFYSIEPQTFEVVK